MLHEHESAEQQTTAHLSAAAKEPTPQMQLTMFTPLSQKIVDRLKEADLNNLTPLEAMNLLWELKADSVIRHLPTYLSLFLVPRLNASPTNFHFVFIQIHFLHCYTFGNRLSGIQGFL